MPTPIYARRVFRRYLPLTCVLMLPLFVGCATAPVRREIERSVALEGVSFDQVWNEVIDLFGERGWPIENMEKASGFINTDWMRVDESDPYYDCGRPGMSVDSNQMGRFNIVVRQASAVRVTINTNWRAYRAFGGSGGAIDCVSTGVLEQALQRELKERLNISSDSN